MKLNTEHESLLGLFKPHYVFVLKKCWRVPSMFFSTNDIYEAQDPSQRRSRASIILAMQALHDEGFLEQEIVSCRGGRKAMYRAKLTPKEFEKHVKDKIRIWALRTFSTLDWWK